MKTNRSRCMNTPYLPGVQPSGCRAARSQPSGWTAHVSLLRATSLALLLACALPARAVDYYFDSTDRRIEQANGTAFSPQAVAGGSMR